MCRVAGKTDVRGGLGKSLHGHIQAKADNNNVFTCRLCQPGHECKLGDEREDICPAGTASNDDRTMCVPCAAREYSSRAGLAGCTDCPEGYTTHHPGSSSGASDGEYTFRPFSNKDISLRVYCHNMASGNPKEFLSLPSGPDENYATVFSDRLKDFGKCSGEVNAQYTSRAGTTKFSKLRIKLDQSRIEVIRNDYTFAQTTSGLDIPYGHAGDCYSSKQGCAKGRFKVNLTGTRLQLAPNVRWSLGERAPVTLRIADMLPLPGVVDIVGTASLWEGKYTFWLIKGLRSTSEPSVPAAVEERCGRYIPWQRGVEVLWKSGVEGISLGTAVWKSRF
ncbi:hypothetical protein Bbelb_053800 [Branchiostoma belcheri]|nr:hypothetical protein Bbelb_053800 [Branchiostoma belcheri]